MSYQAAKGGCLLVPSGPALDGKHLYAVLTNCCQDGCHLLVSIQTFYPGEYSDPTCPLKAGEHKFIQHLSWVAYHRCDIWNGEKISEQVADFNYMIHEDASPEMVEKICAGLPLSKRSSPRIKKYFAANCSL